VITRKELRLIVPYTPQHILRLEKQGKFPERIQIGARRVGWYLSDIEAWLAERVRGRSLHQDESHPARSHAQPK
jgi:prophage regulatory protein